jgi:hypothetical protein
MAELTYELSFKGAASDTSTRGSAP